MLTFSLQPRPSLFVLFDAQNGFGISLNAEFLASEKQVIAKNCSWTERWLGKGLCAAALTRTSGTARVATTAATATTVGVTITVVGVIDDEQPENEVVQETIPPTTTVNFTLDPDVRRLRVNDRFFASAPLPIGDK